MVHPPQAFEIRLKVDGLYNGKCSVFLGRNIDRTRFVILWYTEKEQKKDNKQF